MHLDEIINWINGAFGEVTPGVRSGDDLATLESILDDGGYQRYLQDQVNRQIIRDYLINALVLGIITEGGLPAFATQVSTEEGRATMALYMLMSSVEQAAELVSAPEPAQLSRLKPGLQLPPYIKLIQS